MTVASNRIIAKQKLKNEILEKAEILVDKYMMKTMVKTICYVAISVAIHIEKSYKDFDIWDIPVLNKFQLFCHFFG